jgi:CBS domain-containing protein
MKVADVMTKEVVTAGLTTPYKSVVEMLIEHAISAVPVVDEHGRLVGLVSEADLVDKEAYGDRPRRLATVLHDAVFGPSSEVVRRAAALTASGLMSERPATARPGEDVAKVARRMLELRLKRLPVVDEKGGLIGIVSRRDLLRAFTRTDVEINASIRELLASPLHAPDDVFIVRVEVQDGLVKLWGTVERPSDVGVVEGVVRRVPGVVGVDARLEARSPEPERVPVVPSVE